MRNDVQVISQIGFVFIQLIILLAFSPFIVGVIRKVNARLQCRRGASLLQPYAKLAKLFGKQPVISSTTSWIFTAAPYIVFASTVAAGLLMPVFISHTPLKREGTPEDIAGAVHYLLADAHYVTGETLSVDGGRHIAI